MSITAQKNWLKTHPSPDDHLINEADHYQFQDDEDFYSSGYKFKSEKEFFDHFEIAFCRDDEATLDQLEHMKHDATDLDGLVPGKSGTQLLEQVSLELRFS